MLWLRCKNEVRAFALIALYFRFVRQFTGFLPFYALISAFIALLEAVLNQIVVRLFIYNKLDLLI